MQIKIEIQNEEVRKLIVSELSNKLGENFDPKKVFIKVKSRQNYREHEWEDGNILAVYEGDI